MSDAVTSVVLILPEAARLGGNALAVAIGHDQPPGNTYSVPLSATGSAPATHYGCHTWARGAFLGLLQAAQGGTYPEVPGVAAEAIAAVMGSLVVSLSEDSIQTPVEHFDAVASAHGLQRITD